MKEAVEREERLTNDLSSRDKELRSQKAQMAEVENALETEKASSASLQMEVDRLRLECQKTVESLERVERDALITYEYCVEKYKASPEFEDEVYEKASDFHSSGFLDCVRFVGYGNVMDSERHTLDLFHQAELASLEKGVEAADGSGGTTMPEGLEEGVEAADGSGGAVMPVELEREAEASPNEAEGLAGVPNVEQL